MEFWNFLEPSSMSISRRMPLSAGDTFVTSTTSKHHSKHHQHHRSHRTLVIRAQLLGVRAHVSEEPVMLACILPAQYVNHIETQDAMVQEVMDNFSEELLFKNPIDSTLTKRHRQDNNKMERKRRGMESASGVDSSMESEAEDDEDSLSRISFEENRKFARANHSEIEKRRRDKMNSYIAELSTMVPMCSAMNRKLDKLTVLRMAVQHMKTLRGAGDARTEVSQKPSFLSDDELKHLILKAADGFLFVVSCDRGRMLYVSESVKNMLNYTRAELIGQSLFDFLHPKDVPKVKEQLLSSDLAPRERLIDAKTMLPVKTELPQTQSHLCSGARRAFICRMKAGNAIKVEKDVQQGYMCSKKKKTDRKNYSVIHCTGYLKSWPPAKVGIEQEDSEGDSEACNLSCLVAIGNFLPPHTAQALEENIQLEVRPTQFMSRCTPDGKFIYVDQSATAVLGYLPQELLGTSVYEYYHYKDIEPLSETHKRVLLTTEKLESPVYQFKTKDGTFIHLRTKAFSFKNPWTKEIDYIVATNTVVPVVEVSSSGQSLDIGSMNVDDLSAEESNRLPGSTCPGAGKIGRQIAEEVLELHDENNQMAVDSSLKLNRQLVTGSDVSLTNMPRLNQGEGSSRLANINGITQGLQNTVQAGGAMLPDIMEQDATSESNPDANDEAAMAVIMSLLEADAGLGGPVDFSDLPWPL